MAWFLSALFSAVATAGLILLSQFGLGITKVDVFLLSSVQSIIMAIMLVSTSMMLGKFSKHALQSFNMHSWIILLITGSLAALSWFFYFTALQSGTVLKVEALVRFYFALTIIITIVLLGRPFTLYMAFGLLLVSLGLYLVSFT